MSHTILTINEGLGTIYDRLWKREILLSVKQRLGLNSITEVDVGIPIIDSGGVGLDTLLVASEFDPVQIVYILDESFQYAEKFFEENGFNMVGTAHEDFMEGRAINTDLIYGNYILEFTKEFEEFVRAASEYSENFLFFESNHLNFGHSLLKVLGERFMIAPWVSFDSVRDTTPVLAVEVVERAGLEVVELGMIDFPFFAPPSGVSPFKARRTLRGDFSLKPLSVKQRSLIEVGFKIEKLLPRCVMYLSHMFYVLARVD